MKLWLLRPIKDLPDEINPWEPWYDKIFGFVIRAETEMVARHRADNAAGDENDERRFNEKAISDNPWLDPACSTCVELTSEGEAEIIIEDCHSA